MTDNEINVAIAEACGIKVCNHPLKFGGPPCCDGVDKTENYCNDLNAMHEAEIWLEYNCVQWFGPEGRVDDACEAYTYNLKCTCKCGEWMVLGATARQRAEAFLRTIGKWVD